MDRIKYYPALETDVHILADMRIHMLNELGEYQDAFSTEELRQELHRYYYNAIINREYICWMAFDDNRIAGIGGMVLRRQPGNFKNPSGRVGYLLNMYTGSDYRRMGICSSLLNKLMDTARDMGVSAFELHATPDGAPVYEKFGFHVHHVPTYRKYEPAYVESLMG